MTWPALEWRRALRNRLMPITQQWLVVTGTDSSWRGVSSGHCIARLEAMLETSAWLLSSTICCCTGMQMESRSSSPAFTGSMWLGRSRLKHGMEALASSRSTIASAKPTTSADPWKDCCDISQPFPGSDLIRLHTAWLLVKAIPGLKWCWHASPSIQKLQTVWEGQHMWQVMACTTLWQKAVTAILNVEKWDGILTSNLRHCKHASRVQIWRWLLLSGKVWNRRMKSKSCLIGQCQI